MSAKEFDRELGNYLEPLDGKKFNLKHLFFAENPLDAKNGQRLLNYFYYPDGNRTNYFTAVYVGLGIKNAGSNKREQLEAMKKAGVLVWDIFHKRGAKSHCKYCEEIKVGKKITSVQRTEMIKRNCSLHAFQSSVEALNVLIDEGVITVDKNLNIYFMMPQLTSLPIFNFYNKNSEELKIKGIEVSKKMTIPNPLVPQEGYEQEIFPRHMINVIGGSNTPRANLVKHARVCQGVMHKMKPNQ